MLPNIRTSTLIIYDKLKTIIKKVLEQIFFKSLNTHIDIILNFSSPKYILLILMDPKVKTQQNHPNQMQKLLTKL